MATRKFFLPTDTFPQRLQSRMVRMSYNQSDIARLVGYTPTGVWNWVKGNTFPRAETLAVLANELGVTEDWLRDGDVSSEGEPASPGIEQPATVAERVESLRVEIATLTGYDLDRVKLMLELGAG